MQRIAYVCLTLVTVLAIVGGTVYFAGLAGVGSERLRSEAQKAITALAGFEVSTELASARLTPDGTRLLALEVRDVRIARAETDETMLEAGTMRFGLRLLPLLSGRIQLDSASIDQARFVPDDDLTDGPGILNAEGLVDPSLVSEAVFKALHRAFDALDAVAMRHISLGNVTVPLSDDGEEAIELSVSQLALSRAHSGEVLFDGEAELASRAITFEGSASREAGSGRIGALAAELAVLPGDGRLPDAYRNAPAGMLLDILGSVEISASGKETDASVGRLDLDVNIAESQLWFGAANMEVDAAMDTHSRFVSIESARFSSGRTHIELHGSAGPLEEVEEKDDPSPSYAFELSSRDTTVAPLDSPEPALPLAARISGRFHTGDSRLVVESGLGTRLGELMASAAVEFERGLTPGVTLAIDVSQIPTSHAKQLWPWFAAPGARSWVLDNVFGGQVVESSLQMRVPPGRLGNGEPLTSEEVRGRFEAVGTRFDLAGDMPPVREGVGAVEFRGTDVDIALSSGTVYLPSGRTVAASDGMLTIRDAHVRPRIGDLNLGIQGDAPAVVELAGYDPVNLTRFIELSPDEISGDVSGRVEADIPLQAKLPSERLGWRVSLDYEDLSLSRPFEGQIVTEAEGTLLVEPDRADIEARARLNGIPSRLSLVEPLGDSGVERARDVALELDDESRNELAPGLAAILSGPTPAEVEPLGAGRNRIVADLRNATLSLPWVGWRKGAGIPATASFVLEISEGGAVLSDFELTGETFAASGAIEIADGTLASARFPSAKLNPGDEFSVDIDSSGQGYAISVAGTSLDARSLVRRYGSDSSASPAEGGASESVPVTLEAQLDTVGGFNDERLSNVAVTYRGSGAAVDVLDIGATTRSGAALSISNRRNGERRTVEMDSADAGAALRFFDIYEHVEGGTVEAALSGSAEGPLTGNLEARDFHIVNEPRLGSLVAATPSQASGRQDDESIDASRVQFDRAAARLEKGDGYLVLGEGVLSSARIGTTFEGTLYDAEGNISMTGTFLPAYGINRVFGELPLIGHILGAGPDGGLIGITYRLTGKTGDPQLQTNPISAIAPGIFRQIFEFQ